MSVQDRDHIRRMAEDWSVEHVRVCACHGTGYLRLDVPRDHPLFGIPVPCVCRRDHLAAERAARLRRVSGLSDVELTQWSLDRFDPTLCRALNGRSKEETVRAMRGVLQVCRTYAAAPVGWLLLQGLTGVGKTHLAFGIAVETLRHNRPAMASNIADLLDTLRAGYQDGTYDALTWQVRDVELLVLDDLGAHRMTDWATDALYQLINHRYARRLPLVVTTNADLRSSGLDERIISRVMEGAGVDGGWTRVLTLPCADFRPIRRMRSA